MTKVANLDDYNKVTVAIQGKEYEVKVPSLDELEEFDGMMENLQKRIKKPEDFKKFAKQLFVKAPSDEVLGQLTTTQYSKLLDIVNGLVAGDTSIIDDVKKK